MLLVPINPLHNPLRGLSSQLCTHPGKEAVFPNDQFLLGRRAAVVDTLTAMVPVSRYYERYLFTHLAVRAIGFTYVQIAPLVKPTGSLDDQGIVINRTGVFCRLNSSAWRRTCTIRPSNWRRVLRFLPHSSVGLTTCLEHASR